MQYQHKILRKYAMLGMIKYCAVPYFHSLVTKKDYKMICIFEVFAQNRNEDDFLENLGFYSNQRHWLEMNEVSSPEQAQQANTENIIFQVAPEGDQRQPNHQNKPVQDQPHQLQPIAQPQAPPSDPNMRVLQEIQSKLQGEEFNFFKDKVNNKERKTLMIIKSYLNLKDQGDLVNSLHLLYKKQNPK